MSKCLCDFYFNFSLFFLKLANFLFSYNLHSKPEDVVVKDDKDLQMSSHGVKSLSTQEKNSEQNRIRQLAFKACEKMPKDYKSFCVVAAHLMKNAHRYYNTEEYAQNTEMKTEMMTEVKTEMNEDSMVNAKKWSM